MAHHDELDIKRDVLKKFVPSLKDVLKYGILSCHLHEIKLSPAELERLRCLNSNEGGTAAIESLLQDHFRRRIRYWDEFLAILRRCDYRDEADKLEKEFQKRVRRRQGHSRHHEVQKRSMMEGGSVPASPALDVARTTSAHAVGTPNPSLDKRKSSVDMITESGIIPAEISEEKATGPCVDTTLTDEGLSAVYHIAKVKQPLLMQAVLEEFKEEAIYLHPQRIYVDSSKHTFKEPVEMRLDVSAILKQIDGACDPSGFFVFRRSDDEVTDITSESQVQLQGHELVYHCVHFSDHIIGWTLTCLQRFFALLCNYAKVTFWAKLCPTAAKEKSELTLRLFCHAEGADCLQHDCDEDDPKELYCQTKLAFSAEIACEGGDIVKDSEPVLVDKMSCMKRGVRIDELHCFRGQKMAGRNVLMKAFQLSKGNKEILLSRIVKVQKSSSPSSSDSSSSDRDTDTLTLTDTVTDTSTSQAAKELHYQLLKTVDEYLVPKDFSRLKAYCELWIEPAQLQHITSTWELLKQLQSCDVIKVGDYHKLIKLLKEHNLGAMKEKVEKLAKEIADHLRVNPHTL